MEDSDSRKRQTNNHKYNRTNNTRGQQQTPNRAAAASTTLPARTSTHTTIQAAKESEHKDEVLPPSPGPSYSTVVTKSLLHQPLTVKLPPETPTKKQTNTSRVPKSPSKQQQHSNESRPRRPSGGERPTAQEQVNQMRRNAEAMRRPPAAEARPMKVTEPVSPPVEDSARTTNGEQQQQENIAPPPQTNTNIVTPQTQPTCSENTTTLATVNNTVPQENITTLNTVNNTAPHQTTDNSTDNTNLLDNFVAFTKSQIQNSTVHKLIDAIVKAIRTYGTQGTFSSAVNAFMSHMMGF